MGRQQPSQVFRKSDNKRIPWRPPDVSHCKWCRHSHRGRLEPVINWPPFTQTFDESYLRESSNLFHCAVIKQMSASLPSQGYCLMLGETGGLQSESVHPAADPCYLLPTSQPRANFTWGSPLGLLGQPEESPASGAQVLV